MSQERKMTHSDLKKLIAKLLWDTGNFFCWVNETGMGRALSNNQVMRFGLRGSSDVFAVRRPEGRFYAFEAKINFDPLKDTQENFERVVKKFGGEFYVVRYSQGKNRFTIQFNGKKIILGDEEALVRWMATL